MAIFDNDGTALCEEGKMYDSDGTADFQIGKIYDNNGTADSLIYNSETVLLDGSTNLLGTPAAFYGSSDGIKKCSFSQQSDGSYLGTFELEGSGIRKGGMQFPNLIETGGATTLEIQFSWTMYGGETYHHAFVAASKSVSGNIGDHSKPTDAYNSHYFLNAANAINAQGIIHTVKIDISNCTNFYFRFWTYTYADRWIKVVYNHIKMY